MMFTPNSAEEWEARAAFWMNLVEQAIIDPLSLVLARKALRAHYEKYITTTQTDKICEHTEQEAAA